MTLTVALAGDTMLGRGVAAAIAEGRRPLVAPDVAEAAAEADLFVANLECCISERGEPWPDPAKPFFFRAPPEAAQLLAELGVDCVTLANNHALDYGRQALLDTLEHLAAAGLEWVGAGPDESAARAPRLLEAGGQRLAVVAFSDHPRDFAAGANLPGIAFVDLLGGGLPGWLDRTVAEASAGAAVLVSPHWGPNMTTRPPRPARAAAAALRRAGAALVAGHSAHVFHGVDGPVLFDLGELLDDYAVDLRLRNDLGVLWLASLDGGRATRVEAVPLRLDYCHTRLAEGEDRQWVHDRLRVACAEFATPVASRGERLVIDLVEAGG